MTPEVARAVEELRTTFADTTVKADDAGDGGAYITIARVDPGAAYVQGDTWVRFAVGFQYPHADVYPLFVRPDLARADGQPHGEGIAQGEFEGVQALQLSRRSNRLNPATDTAALKVTKVLDWLRRQ